MVKFVISMSRAQKRLVLLLLDLGLVPIAFAASFVIFSGLARSGGAVVDNWPLIPLLVVVAFTLSLSLGTSNIRLKQYDMAAVQKTALFAILLSVSSLALAELGKLGIPHGYHVVFGMV